MFALLKRIFTYNGSLEFQALNDKEVSADYQHRFVVDHYGKYLEGRRILDAGCWTGPIESAISKNNLAVELTGIDENEEALQIARESFPNFKFHSCSLIDSEGVFPKNHANYFDVTIFLDVIEHLPQGKELTTLKLFNKVLKTNGVIILSTMADHPFNFIDPAWFFGHRHYKLPKLETLLGQSGFTIKEVLKIGNLFWDIDILFLYIYKHIFRKKYQTGNKMREKIQKGFDTQKTPTRYYILAKKEKESQEVSSH